MRVTFFSPVGARAHRGLSGTTGATAEPATARPTTSHADAQPIAIFTEYLDAAVAQDREKLKRLVLLPADEERRKWVLHVIGKGELPPRGVKRLSPSVKMEGPVAVAHVTYEMSDGSREQSPPGFLVRRDGRWQVVVDYFEGGGLTEEEMQVVGQHLSAGMK